MNVLYNILIALGSFLVAYLIGAIPTGVIIGHIFFHDDPRKYGSHNSGGTNAGRAFGKIAGLSVIILDMLKSIIVFWGLWMIFNLSSLKDVVPLWDEGIFYNFMALPFCAFGHCYSIYLKFGGGKAVSCFMGGNMASSYFMFILGLISFLALFLKKKIMSVATIGTASLVLLFQCIMTIIEAFLPGSTQYFVWGWGLLPNICFGWEMCLASFLMLIILVVRHIPNLQRLQKGQEKPVSWSKEEK